MFEMTDQPIDGAALASGLADPAAGALCCFDGRVRNHHAGKAVRSLDYESFGALAAKEGARVVAEARERFDVIGVRAMHRTGALEIGDVAVWVGVTAAHRGEAFDACRWVIDEIKHRLPVWKRERYQDGSEAWVNCSHDHAPATGAHDHQTDHSAERVG